MKDARQTFLGYWFRQLLSCEELLVFGDGKQRRDFNYVNDVVRAFLLAATRDDAIGKIYNLGDTEVISLGELAELLVGIHPDSGGYRVVPFPSDRKAIDIGDYYADFTKIQRELQWEPRVSLADGLTQTVEFYREHRGRYWQNNV